MPGPSASPYTVEQYLSVLTNSSIPFTDTELALLEFLYDAPDHGARASDLLYSLGYTNHGPVNAIMSRLAKRFYLVLGGDPPERHDDGRPFWFSYISWSYPVENGWKWILYPELVKAIEMLEEQESHPQAPDAFEPDSLDFEGVTETVVPTEKDKALLSTMLISHFGEATASELALSLGWHVATVNRVFGGYAHRVADKLGISRLLPLSPTRQKPEYWFTIARGENAESRGFIWFLREGFQREVKNTTWFGERASISPHRESEALTYLEGALYTTVTTAYERNPTARHACISHYGTSCIVCGFNFQDAYGDLGAGLIEVHHLDPIAQSGGKHRVDPIRDLRPVCANCHTIIHRSTPPLTIAEATLLWNSYGNTETRTR